LGWLHVTTVTTDAMNSSILLLVLPVAMACAGVNAAESHELPPRCEKSIKIIRSELAALQIEHPPTGRVELEFTIDALGYVSDPVVVQSTEPRLDKEALRSVVLWRYAPPSTKCRHRTSVTFEIKDRADA
jgi:TonB family protein